MIWIAFAAIGLLGLLLFLKEREGRLKERLSSSQAALDAAKERADVENINNSLGDDILRQRLLDSNR